MTVKDYYTLLEMQEFIHKKRLTYEAFKEYIEKNEIEEWLQMMNKTGVKSSIRQSCKEGNYDAAKRRNQEFYQWCKDNGFSVTDGLFHIPEDKPEWMKIFNSSASLRRLHQMEREDASKEAKRGKPNTRRPKKVRCLDDGLVFPSINKTAEHYGIRRTHDISDCCYGVIGSVKGLHFEFVNEE